jgi:drug/metabolite transporter (DMT)-like permease
LWFGVYMVALNWGEQHVDAGTAAMVVNVGPILIALLSGWLLREGLRRSLLLGITVSFAGVILVGIATSTSRSPSLLGLMLCLLAAVSYAVAVVSQKPALRHASALQVTTFGCAVGTIAWSIWGCSPRPWRSRPGRTPCRGPLRPGWAPRRTWSRR